MFGELSRTLDPLLTLQQALDKASGHDFFGLATTDRGAFPPVSVWKGDGDFLVTAELPGVRKDEIELEIKNDLLRLSGERRPDYDRKEVSVHRRERNFGRFDRTVKLPFAVDATAVTADFKDGVLTVRLPLTEAAKPKKITIA